MGAHDHMAPQFSGRILAAGQAPRDGAATNRRIAGMGCIRHAAPHGAHVMKRKPTSALVLVAAGSVTNHAEAGSRDRGCVAQYMAGSNARKRMCNARHPQVAFEPLQA
ncbi:hypothetical protein C1O66_12225 [Paucibacter aquatile]|uniref:Uncharacterized protein n=1 Tax=Kinneretia aquatilis TaxID=2070761 RepID=A0A2N8KXT8_9BURK|nr:hypothetical protein C1O66_12225 [Paucibacter aquatile]